MSRFLIKQIQEGSIIFEKPFGVKVYGINMNDDDYKFTFKVYINDEVIKEFTTKTNLDTFYFNPIDLNSYKIYKIGVEIYIKEVKIGEAYTKILDYIEDFISIKQVKLQLVENKLFARVDSNLNLPKEEYAYYLDKDDYDAIETTWYSPEKEHIFPLSGKGNYSVRVFCRIVKNDGSTDSVTLRTNTINIEEEI